MGIKGHFLILSSTISYLYMRILSLWCGWYVFYNGWGWVHTLNELLYLSWVVCLVLGHTWQIYPYESGNGVTFDKTLYKFSRTLTKWGKKLLCFTWERRTKQIQPKNPYGIVIKNIDIQLFKDDKSKV